ncbi:MAG TPA: DMT family transporter [Thermoplasmata archaeon]|nr:DMT family transporter [Thermoplasmata archaeon]
MTNASDKSAGLPREMQLPLAVLLVVMAINYPLFQVGLDYAPPIWFAFLRAALGAAATWLLLLSLGRLKRLPAREAAYALLLGIPAMGIVLSFQLLGMLTVGAGQASVYGNSVPLWILLFVIAFGRRPDRMLLAAGALGFIGTAVVAFGSAAGLGSGSLVGALLLLVAAALWGLTSLLARRTFPLEHLETVNAWELLSASAVLIVWALLTESPNAIHWSEPFLFAILWTGAIGIGIAYTIWYLLLSRARAAEFSQYLFVVPLIALGISAAFLGEAVTALQALGIAMVLGSVYLVSRSSGSEAPSAHIATPGR